MQNTSPESTGSNNKESGLKKGNQLIDSAESILALDKRRHEAEKLPVDDPSRGLANFKIRREEVNILSRNERVTARLAEVDSRLKQDNLSQEERDELVKENTSLQNEVLKPSKENTAELSKNLSSILIPEFSKPRGSADKTLRERTVDDLLKEDGSSRFVTINDEPKTKIQAQEESGKEVENKTPEIKPTEAQDASRWAEGMSKNNPDEKFAPTGANPEEIPVEKKSTESETDVDMSYVEMATGVPYGSLSKKEEEGVDTRYVDMALGNSSAVPENKTPEKLDVDIENRKKVMGAKNFDELFAIMDSFGASIPSETHGTISTEHLKTMISNYENGVTPVHFGSGPDALIYITKTYGLREKVYDLLVFSQKLENRYIKNYEEKNQQEAQDASRWAEGMSKNNPDEKFAPTGANPEEVVVEKKPTDEEIEAARKLKELNDFKKIAAEYTANDDIVRPMNGDVQPVKEIVSYLQESAPLSQEIKKPEDSTETIEKKRRFTPEEYAAQIEIWKKSIEGSEKAVENAEKALQESREKSKKNLEAMGLTKVGKGLEAFKNMSGKKKLLLGIALAGLSVVTGGATSFISTGLSALTFGLRDFDKEKAKAQEKGEVTTKGTMLKSAVTGLVLALGTGALFHLAGDAVSAASQQFSPMMDSIKHFFSPEHAAAASSVVSSSPDIIPPVVPDAAIAASIPDAVMGAMPSLPTDYVIQPGDNLTNIIREHIFTSADATSGFNALSHAQQENVIQNFVQSGAFPNPDHIIAGATLDLNSIRDSILQGSVNGEALISHASTLDSASIADNIRNGMSDSVATAEPSMVTDIPSSTEVDLGAVATEVEANAPFVSESIVNMDAQPATVYASAPTVTMPPEGSVLLDGSGNQVLDGSGNPVRLTNYEGTIGSFGDTQFTNVLSSSSSPISPEFNTYVQQHWETISDSDILKMKGSLLDTIRNGNDEHLKSLFEGKAPGDLKIAPYLGNLELISGTQDGQVIGASFKPNGLFNDDLHKNGLDLSKLIKRP